MADTPPPIVLPAFDKTRNARALASPWQFYLQGNERLRITSFNAATGIKLTISGRYFQKDGTFSEFDERHIPNTDRTAKSQEFVLTGSLITNLKVDVSTGTALVGQCYVRLELIIGSGATAILLGLMLAGYVSNNTILSWPGSPIQDSLDGGGYLHSFQGTNPAAGNAVHEVCPTNAKWEVLGVFLNFVTSAAAGNRQPILSTSPDGFGINAVCPAANLYPPSTNRSMSWQPGINAVLSANLQQQLEPLPARHMIGAGGYINIDANGIDTADDFSGPFITVREWIVP